MSRYRRLQSSSTATNIQHLSVFSADSERARGTRQDSRTKAVDWQRSPEEVGASASASTGTAIPKGACSCILIISSAAFALALALILTPTLPPDPDPDSDPDP